MRQEERASIMRIVSDLIKADGIIDTREIDYLDDLRARYSISREDEICAADYTLSQALKCIKDADDATKHAFVNDFNQVAMSDDFCAREEALILMALRLMLTINLPCEATVLSFDSSVINFENSQILYLESEFDKDVNRQMLEFYREICSEVRLAGFELVYLPKVSEHYSSIAEADLLRIVKYLYPKVSTERLQSIITQMLNLSSTSFCNNQLSPKFSIKELRCINPSFLIKIGESTVNDKKMSNFLLVEIEDNPLTTIRTILDLLAEHYHNLRLNYIQEAKNRFIFTGYYRQIFDILMLRKGIKSAVVLDPSRERIYFPEADAILSKIHRREKALYALFLMESASGGINFSPPESPKQLERYEKRMKAIMRKYQLIYRMFGGDAEKAPNIEIPEIRLPMISLLKKQLSQLKDILYHVDDYMIQRNIYGNYSVNIPSSLCCCCGAERADIKLLSESDDWIRIAAL
ncbi:hypothetical protein [Hallella bergensis]|uniref:hypothetical protein n=1 Tax=Hallella bergensis TaxID=242750 RepID=UPI0023F53C61|nr:hypothetical protein [Hallella bergensis]